LGRISQSGLMRGTEEVCAVVVPSEEIKDRSRGGFDIAEEIRRDVTRLSEDLAPYKRPSKVYVRFEELPKTTTRKIKRAVLLDWVAGQQAVPSEASVLG